MQAAFAGRAFWEIGEPDIPVQLGIHPVLANPSHVLPPLIEHAPVVVKGIVERGGRLKRRFRRRAEIIQRGREHAGSVDAIAYVLCYVQRDVPENLRVRFCVELLGVAYLVFGALSMTSVGLHALYVAHAEIANAANTIPAIDDDLTAALLELWIPGEVLELAILPIDIGLARSWVDLPVKFLEYYSRPPIGIFFVLALVGVYGIRGLRLKVQDDNFRGMLPQEFFGPIENFGELQILAIVIACPVRAANPLLSMA